MEKDKEIKIKRIFWDDSITEFSQKYIDDKAIKFYREKVNGEFSLMFGFFKDENIKGLAIYHIYDNKLICDEVYGKGLRVDKLMFGFSIGLAKFYNCDKFIIGSGRKAMERIALNNGFKRIYSEFEVKIDGK